MNDVQSPPEPKTVLKAQKGPQEAFLSCTADIAIYGGSAGSGKSFALLMEPLRNCLGNPDFGSVVFRRTRPSIRNPGGLWDESMKLYGPLGGSPKESTLEWVWESGARTKFDQLEYDTTVLDWHGAQVAFIGFDELTEFSQYQFFYMMSRNRSTCGVKPYMRATCNPDADSWVAEFIAWWVDQDTGFPIAERSGVIRWFVRVGDELHWADDPRDLTAAKLGVVETDNDGNTTQTMPKSVTFIAATIYDNVELLRHNPEYLGNLLAQPTVERERLLRGNWKIKPAAGLLFNRAWVELVDPDEVPRDVVCKRGWDLAGTPKTQLNDPDWTAGTKIGKSRDKIYYVMDHVFLRDTPGRVKTLVRTTAELDGRNCEQNIPQDPGQAGKGQIIDYNQTLDGYPMRSSPETGDKVTRFNAFSATAQAGRVRVVRGAWNARWFSVLEAFDGEGKVHDDDADSTSRAFNAFLDATTGLIEYYAQMQDKLVKDRLEANGPAVRPSVNGGGIRVRGPVGVTMLTDQKGQPIFQDDDGFFVVSPKHAALLRRPNSGFVVVE